MKWVSKILGRKDDLSPGDPTIDQCESFAEEFQITLTDKEGIMSYQSVIDLQNLLSGAPMYIRMYFTLCVFFAFLMVCLNLELNYYELAILVKQETLSKKRESCFHGPQSSILLGSFMPIQEN